MFLKLSIGTDEVYFKEKSKFQRFTNSLVNSKKVNVPVQRSLIPGHNDLRICNHLEGFPR